MVVVNVMIGLCSPPYGLLLLMMVKITGVPLNTYVPWFTLVVPRLLGYKG